MTMITFDTDTIRFTYRVAGIALHERHVLMQTTEQIDFWFPPGGRCELLEPAEATLVREMREELGVDVAIERLLWVVENFFVYQGKAGHELAFYFLMHLPNDPALLVKNTPLLYDEAGTTLTFQWFPLDALEDVIIYPTFLRTAVQQPPAGIEHLVHTDQESAAALASMTSALVRTLV